MDLEEPKKRGAFVKMTSETPMAMVLELVVVFIAISLCFMKYQNRAHDGMCPAVSNMWSVMPRLSESGVLDLSLDPQDQP